VGKIWKLGKREGSVIARVLQITGLTKDFIGLRALSRVDIQLEKGEIFGLIGPNGSGKTTLLNVVTGFLPPTAGAVTYENEMITGLPAHAIAAKGMVRTFQITSIFSDLTVEENIVTASYLNTNGTLWGSVFHTRAYREEERRLRQRASELLDLLGLREKMSIPANALGLGEQRRIEIAIALAANPKVLLLDEPAAGLNPTEAVELVHLLRSIQQMGITLFIIEHNMKVIMSLCTRIAVLDYGLKIAEGTADEIARNQKVISVYLGGKQERAES
jgi:branched-chain amino acid transport system ATP-binding protein